MLTKSCLYSLGLAAYVSVALCGCTRPGHPGSYGIYQSCTSSQSVCTYPGQGKAWPTSASGHAEQNSAPPAFKATGAPFAIWQARGAAWNKHLQYQAAAFHAENVQDGLAIPLFGAAISTVAAGIASAGTTTVAAAGLGGATVGGIYTYIHPDKDITTDLNAAFALLCVVNVTKPLTYHSVVPLLLDKAALQDALDQLNADSALLMEQSSTDATVKQAQTAVTSAQSAAKSTLNDLNNAIEVYDSLPTEIYSAVSEIDYTAQSSGSRALDYGTILASLQTSNTHATNAANSSTQVAKATSKAATLKTTVAGQKKSKSKTPAAVTAVTKNQSLGGDTTQPANPAVPKANTNLANITTTATDKQTADATTGDTPTSGKSGDTANTDTGNSESGSAQEKVEALARALNTTATNDLEKVNQIASDAEQDIPIPNFAGIKADIEAATMATVGKPCITPSSSVPTAKTDTSQGSNAD